MHKHDMDDFQGASILFVDDEADLLDLLKAHFEPLVGAIHIADRPSVALEIASKHHVDLVVLDLDMPEMNGIQLLEKLQAIDPAIKSIFLSGRGRKESVQAALRLETLDFIDKPFELEDLQDGIAQALKKARGERARDAALNVIKMKTERNQLKKKD